MLSLLKRQITCSSHNSSVLIGSVPKIQNDLGINIKKSYYSNIWTSKVFDNPKKNHNENSFLVTKRNMGVPGNMGMDHIGIVVPNVAKAAEFLIEVFDAEFDWEVKREPKPNFGERDWANLFGVHPETYMPHVLMLKCGDAHLTQYVELFEFVSPEQSELKGRGGWHRFSDVGNSYISFTVKDIKKVVAHVKEKVIPKWPGVQFIQDPPWSFPLRGDVCTSTFLVSPWGQWIELTEWQKAGQQGTVIKKTRNQENSHPLIGKHISSLPTPSFLVDLDSFEHNSKLLSSRIKAKNINWRPPCKAHKCPAIANKLQSYGAKGIVVLTLSEAQSFAAEGIRDIFIANEIIGAENIEELSLLAKRVDVLRVNVDDEQNIRDINAAVKKWEITTPIEILVELNIGHNRCGVTPEQSVRLAQVVKELEERSGGVKFMGISGYEGHTPILPPEEKKIETEKSHSVLRLSKELIEKQGIKVQVVTGGGSCNYIQSLETNILTELQAGGGAIVDQLYYEKAGLGLHGHKIGAGVLTQIMSGSIETGRFMGDAGFKAVGWHPFGGLPRIRDENKYGLNVSGLSAEHTRFLKKSENVDPSLFPKRGDKIVLVPGYTDAMGFLHRQIVAIRNDVVEDVWPTLSGKTWF